MNKPEAKQILSAYRHGTDDEKDALFAEAMALARPIGALSAWLAVSLAFAKAVRGELADVKAPLGLQEMILAQGKIIRPRPWWNQHLRLRPLAAAAAAVLVTGALVGLWMKQRPVNFAEFRRDIADQSWGPAPH